MTTADQLQLTCVNAGTERVIRGRRSHTKRTVRLDRHWHVFLEGRFVAEIFYELLTRETGSPRKRYVSDRWQSPGWTYRIGTGHKFEVPSRKAALETIADQLTPIRAATR